MKRRIFTFLLAAALVLLTACSSLLSVSGRLPGMPALTGRFP